MSKTTQTGGFIANKRKDFYWWVSSLATKDTKWIRSAWGASDGLGEPAGPWVALSCFLAIPVVSSWEHFLMLQLGNEWKSKPGQYVCMELKVYIKLRPTKDQIQIKKKQCIVCWVTLLTSQIHVLQDFCLHLKRTGINHPNLPVRKVARLVGFTVIHIFWCTRTHVPFATLFGTHTRTIRNIFWYAHTYLS